MTNSRIKEMAKEKKVKLWEIADQLGITDATFSRKLRKELSQDQREQCMEIIEKISANREE